MKKEKLKCVIYGGVDSPSWDSEAGELAEVLEKEGVEVLRIIPISGLECPKIEYIKNS